MRVIEAVTVHQDLDPYLSLDALASGWKVRRDRRTKRTALTFVTGYAGLSRRTLQDLINDTYDPLPSYRVGGKLLVRRSEFDRWMARRKNHKPQSAARLAAADAQGLLRARPKK